MSNTKGSMLISNADAVGTELVNQLGGTGYKPTEWANAINLLGIKSADIPTALAGITPGSYSGSERGSIKYTTGNAVGAMLNKKYNTNRGFKPVEWEDAISKLTPLPENTVSGDICNVSDGADDVPIKSWDVEIAPTLTGKSAVECTQTGKNLYVADLTQDGANRVILFDNIYLPIGNYYISLTKSGTVANFYMKKHSGGSWSNVGGYNKTEVSVTISEADYYDFSYYISTGVTASDISNVQLEVGMVKTDYETPTAPTVNTVDLGRTIYGGTADVVKGTCEPINWLDGINGYTVLANATAQTLIGSCDLEANVDYTLSCSMTGTPTQRTRNRWAVAKSSNMWDGTAVFGNDFYTAPQQTFTLSESGTYYFFIWSQGIDVDVSYDDFQCEIGSTASDYSPYFEPFTFTPITPTPETALGVNNFWNDTGSNTITYYQDLDLITE